MTDPERILTYRQYAASNPGEKTYDNFGAPWPKAARPAKNPRHKVISEDPIKKVYVYESPGYHFYADEPIAYDASMHFATLFETTREYMNSLPLGDDKNGANDQEIVCAHFWERRHLLQIRRAERERRLLYAIETSGARASQQSPIAGSGWRL
jgi:hypothetical protein